MVKTRRCGVEGGMSNETNIKIIGPRSIVPISFTAIARKDQTWYSFLAENGLKLTSNDGLYVRTLNLRDVSGNRDWHGFGGELNKEVGLFLGKFKKERKCHTVRLMRKTPATHLKVPSKGARRQQNRRPAGAEGSGFGGGVAWNLRSSSWEVDGEPNVVSREEELASQQFEGRLEEEEEEQRGMRGQLVLQAVKLETDEAATTVAFVGGGGENEEAPQQDDHVAETQFTIQRIKLEEVEEATYESYAVGGGGDGEEEVPQQEEVEENVLPQLEEVDEDDNMSVMTSASQEARCLRRKGIRNEDLKNPARGRLDKFENGYLLRARQEIKRLKKNNLWIRSYQRAPLACYLLEQILKP